MQAFVTETKTLMITDHKQNLTVLLVNVSFTYAVQSSSARVIFFSALSVCGWLCLFVNTI